MRDYEALDVSLEGDVLRIAFDDPENSNAISREAHGELTHVFKDAWENDDARVVMLTGNGDVFSAGGDLDRMKHRIEHPEEDPFRESIREAEEIIEDIVNLEKPLVAKVNGHCTGLGTTLALFSDLVYMDESGKIGDPHVSAGLVAGDGGAVVWPLIVGLQTAKEFLMTGKMVTGAEAADIGLVNEALPSDELDERVDEVIDELASGPQVAIRYTKVALNEWLHLGVDNVLRESLALEAVSQRHPDHAEAVDAFLEGREPDFPSGRDRSEE